MCCAVAQTTFSIKGWREPLVKEASFFLYLCLCFYDYEMQWHQAFPL